MTERILGSAGGWRYIVKPDDRRGVFAVVRRDVPQDVLEDEIAFCYSEEVAEVIAVALVARERRKSWSQRRFP
jgi:hypothetical protein